MFPSYMYDALLKLIDLTDNQAIAWRETSVKNLVTEISDVSIQIAIHDRSHPDVDGFDIIIGRSGAPCKFSCHEHDEYMFIDSLWNSAVANMHGLPEILKTIF